MVRLSPGTNLGLERHAGIGTLPRMDREATSQRPRRARRIAPANAAGWVLGFAGLALTAIMVAYWFATTGVVGWDAVTYLAAGERLNAGHDLYALVAGDRYVWIDPPFWTVPLLSPPFIAVVWRPLAAVPFGFALWWIVSEGALVLTALWMLVRRPAVVGPLLIALALPIAWEIKVANVNGALVAGTVAIWWLVTRRHDRAAGAVIALMAAVKLWPAYLLIWFMSQRRFEAVRGFVIGGAICAAISVLGAGMAAHVEYLSVIRGTPPGMLALATLVGYAVGASLPWLGYAIWALGAIEIWALRDRPWLAWAVTVGAMVLGAPVINIPTFALLLAMVAPLVTQAVPDERARQLAATSLRRITEAPSS